MFGGFQAEGGRNNDVYVAELTKETLVSLISYKCYSYLQIGLTFVWLVVLEY